LGTKRLLIVADGALHYLPFAALPAPTAPDASSLTVPLIAAHEIVTLPSASVLAVLRRELIGRQPAPKSVAVLADPVFTSDDARVRRRLTSRPASGANRPTTKVGPTSTSISPLERAGRGFTDDADRAPLRRLLFTRDEAEAILAMTPPSSGLKAFDFQATRKLATSAALGHYRILHFSTHGLLDGKHPELSGLVFSLVDERGQPQDGFLRLHEIYNLKLNADLVVLSACQTALGEEVKGEGLIGLTRGFMYAGAPSVVASLWQVDDGATAQLMKVFYRGLLQEQLPAAAALRAAQVEMMKKKHWQSPYYWAAFVLQGEWRRR
jgi:CHAT domain-containing protein